MRHESPEIQQLIAMRDHYRREAQRCEDAIALLGEVGRMKRKADRTLGKVRARAEAEAPTYRGGNTRKPGRISRRGMHSRKQRAQAKTGTRPIDILRGVFRTSGDVMVTDRVMKAAGFIEWPVKSLGGPPNMPPEGKAARLLGLTLKHLAKAGEIRQTANGWIATRKLTPASVNGVPA